MNYGLDDNASNSTAQTVYDSDMGADHYILQAKAHDDIRKGDSKLLVLHFHVTKAFLQ